MDIGAPELVLLLIPAVVVLLVVLLVIHVVHQGKGEAPGDGWRRP